MLDVPAILDDSWDMWRVLASERYNVTKIEIEQHWTMADVEHANLVLDVLEDAEILARPKTPKPKPRR